MSGRGRLNKSEEQGDDWKCDSCDNINFSWRVQCNRCRQLKSANTSGDGGMGAGTKAVLGVAGVALAGFLGKQLWDNFQSSSYLPPAKPPPSPPPSKYWVPPAQRNQPQPSPKPTEESCITCFKNKRNVCLYPCGHVCMCEECAKILESFCPVCMGDVTWQEKVLY